MTSPMDSTTARRVNYFNNDWTYPNEVLFTRVDYYLFIKFMVPLHFILCFGGWLGNILCIRTFYKMSLNDCVTITFFNLAVSDFSYLTLAILDHAVLVVDIILNYFYYFEFIDDYVSLITIFGLLPSSVAFYLKTVLEIFMVASMIFVAFLALQRSLCVIRPLHFKGMFTRSRTIIIMSIIWFYGLSSKMPEFVTIRFVQAWHEFSNRSFTHMVFPTGVSYYNIGMYNYLFNYTILPAICISVIIFGLCTMSYALGKSLRFRKLTSNPSFSSTKKGKPDSSGLDDDTANVNETLASDSSAKSTSKERQAIVQVALVSAMFLSSYLPAIIRFIYNATYPEFDLPKNRYINQLLGTLNAFSFEANASLNFIIYYKHNSKFRRFLFGNKA